jgi:hypothetical protein
MNQDIDVALRGWDFKPGVVQARLVQARNGRQVIQLRIDLGLLQMEPEGRPDGTRPHDCATYFDYLRKQAQVARRNGQSFVLSDEHCLEADREFVQFYQRRLSWLALRNYRAAVADAEHTLAFMDFVRDHSPHEEFTQAHEQYRGFVVFQRTQAAAALAVEQENHEQAVDEVLDGIARLRKFFADFEIEEQFEDNALVQQLRKMETALRRDHGIEETLKEQLNRAVANEEYETAARLRDALRQREK